MNDDNGGGHGWTEGAMSAGSGSPVRIMGIINASPESFYKGSVYVSRRAIRDRAKSIEDEGGDCVDVGGMSTAPYVRGTDVSEREECDRIKEAIGAVRDGCNLPISVDTCRAPVAKLALEEGASIINDVTGLKHDGRMAETAVRGGASVILGAYGGPDMPPPATPEEGDVARVARALLAQSMQAARAAGIPESGLAVDPSIGFFRGADAAGRLYTRSDADWVSRDSEILRRLPFVRAGEMRNVPVVISVSNKSFLGSIVGKSDPSERTYASVAAEAVAVAVGGADIIRTHNVAAARDAALVASKIVARDAAHDLGRRPPDDKA